MVVILLAAYSSAFWKCYKPVYVVLGLSVEKNLNIIVSGNNDKYLEILNLNNFPNIKDGDKVFTSGDGNKYPENLFIGTIKTKKNGDYIVEPSLDINSLNYVYILNWSLKDRGIDIKVDPIFYD